MTSGRDGGPTRERSPERSPDPEGGVDGGVDGGRGRFPASVYGHGAEPDPRFSLANERTFLAWIRTSMALLAAAVALEALPMPVSDGARHASALLFAALGVLGTVQAWIGWVRSERAMRLDLPLPASPGMLPLSAGIVLAVVIAAAGYRP